MVFLALPSTTQMSGISGDNSLQDYYESNESNLSFALAFRTTGKIMTVPIAQTINLVIQILMLGMLVWAYHLYRKKQFMRHAHLMTLAFGMNIASFLLVMTPSIFMSAGTLLVQPITFFNVV